MTQRPSTNDSLAIILARSGEPLPPDQNAQQAPRDILRNPPYPPPRPPAPLVVVPPQQVQTGQLNPATESQRLEELLAAIESMPRTPVAGEASARAMMQCFEMTAKDIERLANDHCARAMQVRDEAISFASVVRRSGQVLAKKIEDESARAARISEIMRLAISTVTEVVAAGEPSPEEPAAADQPEPGHEAQGEAQGQKDGAQTVVRPQTEP